MPWLSFIILSQSTTNFSRRVAREGQVDQRASYENWNGGTQKQSLMPRPNYCRSSSKPEESRVLSVASDHQNMHRVCHWAHPNHSPFCHIWAPFLLWYSLTVSPPDPIKSVYFDTLHYLPLVVLCHIFETIESKWKNLLDSCHLMVIL